MKTQIKTWILNGNLNELRGLNSSDQPSVNELIEIVNLPKRKGVKMIEAILINRFPNALDHYSLKEKQNFMPMLISEVSQDIYCAGWYSDIEFILWNWIHDESTIPKIINLRVVKEDLSDLKSISEKLQLWAYWDNIDEDKSIEIQEWKKLVNERST